MESTTRTDSFVWTEEASGAEPTQGYGRLEATGQVFYFRYRYGRASMLISRTSRKEHNPHSQQCAAYYVEYIERIDRSYMPIDEATDVCLRWVRCYLEGSR